MRLQVLNLIWYRGKDFLWRVFRVKIQKSNSSVRFSSILLCDSTIETLDSSIQTCNASILTCTSIIQTCKSWIRINVLRFKHRVFQCKNAFYYPFQKWKTKFISGERDWHLISKIDILVFDLKWRLILHSVRDVHMQNVFCPIQI